MNYTEYEKFKKNVIPSVTPEIRKQILAGLGDDIKDFEELKASGVDLLSVAYGLVLGMNVVMQVHAYANEHIRALTRSLPGTICHSMVEDFDVLNFPPEQMIGGITTMVMTLIAVSTQEGVEDVAEDK